jgi:hypothetical protein
MVHRRFGFHTVRDLFIDHATVTRSCVCNAAPAMHVDSLGHLCNLLLDLFCVSCARQPRRYQQCEAAK